jgi:hypothetical protein
MSIVIAAMRAVRPSPVERIRAAWSRAMAWTPSEQQMHSMVQAIGKTAAVLDCAIKTAVVLVVLYLAIEIGSAFLPGGAVSRVLGGLR